MKSIKKIHQCAKYLVDSCEGTKYYQNPETALKKFLESKTAHTLAIWNGEQWIVKFEKIFK